MPLDIAALSTTIVGSFLMPWVKKGAQKISEAVKEKFSEAASQHVSDVAKKIWEKVKGAFASDEEKATLNQFEKLPDAARPLVEAVLTAKLEADKPLAEELQKLATSPSPDGAGTAVQISGQTVGYVDARGATISGGIVAGVNFAPPPTTPPGK